MRKKRYFRKKYYSGRLENSWDLEYFHSLRSVGTINRYQTAYLVRRSQHSLLLSATRLLLLTAATT